MHSFALNWAESRRSVPINALAFTDSTTGRSIPNPEAQPRKSLTSENRPPIPLLQPRSASQIHAQNALKAPLKCLNSALIRTLQLRLCVGFVVFYGLIGPHSRPKLSGRPFRGLLAGDLHSFSIHIDPSILQACTFFLWNELLFWLLDN